MSREYDREYAELHGVWEGEDGGEKRGGGQAVVRPGPHPRLLPNPRHRHIDSSHSHFGCDVVTRLAAFGEPAELPESGKRNLRVHNI